MDHPANAPGDFFVEYGCCTSCEVPGDTAPDLFAYDQSGHCFVRRQPRTAAEREQMLLVLDMQELDCIRYRGDDPTLVERIDAMHLGPGNPAYLHEDRASRGGVGRVVSNVLWIIVTIAGVALAIISAIAGMGR